MWDLTVAYLSFTLLKFTKFSDSIYFHNISKEYVNTVFTLYILSYFGANWFLSLILVCFWLKFVVSIFESTSFNSLTNRS